MSNAKTQVVNQCKPAKKCHNFGSAILILNNQILNMPLNMRLLAYTLITLFLVQGCSKEDDNSSSALKSMYFPPLTGNEWETKTIASLGWNQNAVQPIMEFLIQKNTKYKMIPNRNKILNKYIQKVH